MKIFVCPYYEEVHPYGDLFCRKTSHLTNCNGLVDGCLQVQDAEGRYFDELVLNSIADWIIDSMHESQKERILDEIRH